MLFPKLYNIVRYTGVIQVSCCHWILKKQCDQLLRPGFIHRGGIILPLLLLLLTATRSAGNKITLLGTLKQCVPPVLASLMTYTYLRSLSSDLASTSQGSMNLAYWKRGEVGII